MRSSPCVLGGGPLARLLQWKDSVAGPNCYIFWRYCVLKTMLLLLMLWFSTSEGPAAIYVSSEQPNSVNKQLTSEEGAGVIGYRTFSMQLPE